MVQNGRSVKVPLIDGPAPAGFLSDGARAAAAHSQQLLREGIVNDAAFNDVVLPAIAAYLRASGVPVDPEIALPPKRAIAMDTIVKRAVRFFYPDILDATGIHTHVCTQLNAIRELPERDPALEAMAFSAIMTDLQRDSSVIEHDFSAAIARMKELDAPGAADSVRLRRAQGVMWGLMSESTELRTLLAAEARRESAILPFVITAR